MEKPALEFQNDDSAVDVGWLNDMYSRVSRLEGKLVK